MTEASANAGGTAVATQAAGGAVAAYDYGKYMGAGFENVKSTDLKPSFLKILHGGSPLLEVVDGAKPGLIVDTVSKDLYPEILFIPAVHEHVYCAWVPRSPDGSGGAGFGGVYQLNDPSIQAAIKAVKPFERGEDGKMILPTIEIAGVVHELVETHYFHGVQVLANGAQVPASLSFYSTGLSVAKDWLSTLNRQMIVLPDGRSVQYPLFAHVSKLGVVKSEKGSYRWYNFQPMWANGSADKSRLSPDSPSFKSAASIYEQWQAGNVKVDYAAGGGQDANTGGGATKKDTEIPF